MNYYKLKYPNGNTKIVKGKNSLEIIKKYDLCSSENYNVKIIKLEGSN